MKTFFDLMQHIMEIGLCGMAASLLIFGLCITCRWLLAKHAPKLCMRMDLVLRWNHKLLRWSFNFFAAAYFIMMTWGMVAGFFSLLTNHNS